MAKKESTFLNMVVTLFIVTFAAALTLGFVYDMTKTPIALAKRNYLESQLGVVVSGMNENLNFAMDREYMVMPDDGENPKDSLSFFSLKLDDGIRTAVRSFTNNGFSGRFWILVCFDKDGVIINSNVLSHKETPGLGDKMSKSVSDWNNNLIGKNPAKNNGVSVTKDGGEVDAITAATISSRAYCDAINRAHKAYIKLNKGGNE